VLFRSRLEIRSSRRMEKECLRNKEMIWLTQVLAPDFKTIADFRKDNGKAFREFLTLCHKLQLLSFDTVSIDGTKFRGQNSRLTAPLNNISLRYIVVFGL
jgi:transposase